MDDIAKLLQELIGQLHLIFAVSEARKTLLDGFNVPNWQQLQAQLLVKDSGVWQTAGDALTPMVEALMRSTAAGENLERAN